MGGGDIEELEDKRERRDTKSDVRFWMRCNREKRKIRWLLIASYIAYILKVTNVLVYSSSNHQYTSTRNPRPTY